MAGSRRRTTRRAVLAAAVAGAIALAGPAVLAQQAQTDEVRPEVFRGVASSLGLAVQADREALLPIPELFRFIALDGSGAYESDFQEARASLLFPGNGLILGPGLVCGTAGAEFPSQFAPIFQTCQQYKYPLTVFADSFTPDGSTTGSLRLGAPEDPLSANAIRAAAHAGPDATTTDAVIQDLSALGLPLFGPVRLPTSTFQSDGSIITVDSATSRTRQRIVDGKLSVVARSTFSGIRLIGGLVNIGSLRSESVVTDDAAGKRTADAVLEISGVTVAGTPAQITDRGLVLGPSGGGGPLLEQQQAQLNQLLQALNVKVSILKSEELTNRNGAAVASVGGLLVEFGRDVQGLPTIPGPVGELDPNGFYRGTIQLGTTGALGTAANFGLDDEVLGDVSGDLDDLAGDFGGSFSDDGDFETGGAGFDEEFASGTDGAGGSGSAVRGGGATGGGRESTLDPRRVLNTSGNFGDRLAAVYLALMLAVLGLCIVPRLAMKPRLPGSRP